MRAFLAAFFLTLGVVCALAQADNHVGGVGTGMYVGNIVNGAVYSYANGLGTQNVTPAPSFTVSGPSSGVVEAPSTTFTLALTGTTFNGSTTVTISDGSKGGTITPSVGSPGTSTVTVTPTNGATGFTFTYTPVVVATITLTFTNAQSWTNQTPLTYASSSCTAATNAIARMTGAPNVAALTAMICGGVTDGWWAKTDVFYMFASDTQADASTNLVSSSFTGGAVATTFTANAGYTGNGSNAYITTSFQPSTAGGNYTQNSATVGVCDLTANSSGAGQVQVGAYDATHEMLLTMHTTTWASRLNVASSSTDTQTITNSRGSWMVSRTASTGWSDYGPSGSSTPFATPAVASTGTIGISFYILALNSSGSGAVDFNTDQIAYAILGGGFTGTDYANFYGRAHTYLVAVGAPSGC